MSVVIPVHELSDAASTLERLPRLDGEVILVCPQPPRPDVAPARAARPGAPVVPETAHGDRAMLRAGFAAARGDRIVVLARGAAVDAGEIERFVAALDAGCRAVHRAAA